MFNVEFSLELHTRVAGRRKFVEFNWTCWLPFYPRPGDQIVFGVNDGYMFVVDTAFYHVRDHVVAVCGSHATDDFKDDAAFQSWSRDCIVEELAAIDIAVTTTIQWEEGATNESG